MKKIILSLAMISVCYTVKAKITLPTLTKIEVKIQSKIDIKIKNDTDNVVQVYNAGSGGSYSLTKGATTTIKMEEGDKLYLYEKGKKGKLLLEASSAMNGKVQLLSKL